MHVYAILATYRIFCIGGKKCPHNYVSYYYFSCNHVIGIMHLYPHLIIAISFTVVFGLLVDININRHVLKTCFDKKSTGTKSLWSWKNQEDTINHNTIQNMPIKVVKFDTELLCDIHSPLICWCYDLSAGVFDDQSIIY